MFRPLRQRNPGRPLIGVCFYSLCWNISNFLLTVFYRLRTWGDRNAPDSGPLLVISNHQSHLDPVVVGMSLRRRDLNFLARSTLFNVPILRHLILWLNSVPLKQGEPDRAAIRTALEQLDAGRAILIFPEGSRTTDGRIHEFKRGVWVLLTRAKCPVLPIAIEGCYDAWRRGTPFPRLFNRRIATLVGPPIPAETLLAMGAEAGLPYLARLIEDMRTELAGRLAASGMAVSTAPIAPDALAGTA